MTQPDSIFTERGTLRTDLENVRVPAERQHVLDALLAATMAETEAERILAIKDTAVADAVEAHARARAAYTPSTFMDEWRAAVSSFHK